MKKNTNTFLWKILLFGSLIFFSFRIDFGYSKMIFLTGSIILYIYGFIELSKYQKYRKQKLQNEKNIQINHLKNIKDKFNRSKKQIIKNKQKILIQLENIRKNLSIPIFIENNSEEHFQKPIEDILKLKNILKDDIEIIKKEKIWDLFYDNSKFNRINPKIEFDKNIKKVKFIKAPKYYDINSNIKKNKQNIFRLKVEQFKEKYNKNIKKIYESAIDEIKSKIELLVDEIRILEKEWHVDYENFENEKRKRNDELNKIKSDYFKKQKKAIIFFHTKLLDIITYSQNFDKSINVDFNIENKMLIIEYLLPSFMQFPKVKEIRYLKTKNQYREINFSKRELSNIYEDILYRIVLDLLNKSFKNDLVGSIESIVFNGWTNSINRATGLYDKICILSIFCEKKEFMKINLPNVDPKECFKNMKGVSASKITNSVAIKPIISIERKDSRFVPSKEVQISSSTNLALMDWEDFEHLIREIFELEFRINGGEVKVTQSSRDGGVDAIAFDPDPIRGGKIVIQAKRYTNTVGVSAVRDLYGTVMNEGATKGILVTTSDYGSDSFKFAKGKPITLINGGNLLYLLKKHGYNARINIKEAKDELKNRF